MSEQLVTGIARAFNNKTGRVVISPSGQKVSSSYDNFITYKANLKCLLFRFKIFETLITFKLFVESDGDLQCWRGRFHTLRRSEYSASFFH